MRGLSSDNRSGVGDVDRVVEMVSFDAERVVADDQLAWDSAQGADHECLGYSNCESETALT
jgi:hypothetical protein